MSFDQSRSVFNARYHQLSESHRRITEEIKDLEQRIQHLQEFGKELIKKKGECEVILEKIERLANQNDHSTNSEAGGPVFQKSLSWDFEGLTLKDHSAEREKAAQQLENFVDKLEQQLTKNKVELELIEREMHGQNKSEHNPAKDRERTQEMEPMGDQEIERMSCVTAGDETSANTVQELQIFVDLQKKRIEELLEKLQEMENHNDVLSKQKEELLRVNHQWDEQYNLLKNDKDRTIAELRRKTQTVIGAELQGQRDDLGQQSKKHIAELTQKNEDLHQELAKFQEKQQKTDQLWLAAKKMITEEREARASATQQTLAVQERCNALENELRLEKQTQGYLKQEIERLVSGAERGSGGPSGENSRLSSNVAEEIEMLKQQIRVYADDFANERSDRERIQAARELQKEKLKACENEIALLKEQVKIYENDFIKEKHEKERLQRQLRDRRPVTVVQGQDEPWYVVPPNDYPANPVQRRQPFYHERNFRGQYTPREIQELAFQQQQLHPRGGNAGLAAGLCQGCEVDCDVIDGTGGQGTLKCPRCDRKFPGNERRAFDEHIDKCTT